MPRAQVFLSYSHKDKRWLDVLLIHLKPYLRGGSFTAWSDQQLGPGSNWSADIQAALTKTKVAVLLVTPDQTSYTINETINALLQSTDECHLIVGLLDTRPRRLIGVDFANIPGWEIPLAGICWKHPKSPIPTWQENGDATYAQEHFQVIVVEGDVAHHFLKGDCRYPNAIIELIPESSIHEISSEFRKFAHLYATSSKTVLFIASENLCRATWVDLKKKCRRTFDRHRSGHPTPRRPTSTIQNRSCRTSRCSIMAEIPRNRAG